LSDEAQVPLPILKIILGMPVIGECTATTAEQAEDEFRNASSGSEEEYFALLKWIELEDDVANAQEMCECADEYHTTIEIKASEKWEMLSLQNVNSVTEEDDLSTALENCPKGGQAEIIILKKLYEIYKNKN
jgi:hypothetical protein